MLTKTVHRDDHTAVHPKLASVADLSDRLGLHATQYCAGQVFEISRHDPELSPEQPRLMAAVRVIRVEQLRQELLVDAVSILRTRE